MPSCASNARRTRKRCSYGLTLHPEKTRLIEFGRYAEENAKRRGKKPATFDFLGFTHICARSRKGKFAVHVRTIRKRLRRGLKAVAQWCQAHRHDPVDKQQQTLNAKLRGHYQYYGRPTNYRSLRQFYRRGPSHLEGRAESPHTRAMVDVGAVRRHSAPASVVATADYPFLGEAGEERLKNPLR